MPVHTASSLLIHNLQANNFCWPQCCCVLQEGPLLKLQQPLLFVCGGNDVGYDAAELQDLCRKLPSSDVRAVYIPVGFLRGFCQLPGLYNR